MPAPITLFTYAASPYGMKVYWALIFKKMLFDLQYVSPTDQKELAFTNQRIVPVLKIGDEWRLEPGWLQTSFPSSLAPTHLKSTNL